MKFNSQASNGESSIVSEGKLLEIIPVISDQNNQPYMLPPVVYQVPNWLLGFRENHPISMPMQFYMGERIRIPGSNSYLGSTLTFLVRLLEDSPSSGVSIATVDTEAVTALITAIRESVNKYPA